MVERERELGGASDQRLTANPRKEYWTRLFLFTKCTTYCLRHSSSYWVVKRNICVFMLYLCFYLVRVSQCSGRENIKRNSGLCAFVVSCAGRNKISKISVFLKWYLGVFRRIIQWSIVKVFLELDLFRGRWKLRIFFLGYGKILGIFFERMKIFGYLFRAN